MLSQKRRKKRQAHGLKTIEIYRGKQGYGFTISGQQPCVLGNIVAGSPAEIQGLKDGDHLVTVNGQPVAQLSHDQIVQAIGSSSGLLRLQIAEGSKAAHHAQLHHDSDSSDEQYVKPRYTHRTRAKSNSKTNHITTDPQLSRRAATSSPHLHTAQQGAFSKGATLSLAPRREDPFPTIYNPTRPINGRASDFGVFRHSQQQEQRAADHYHANGQLLRGNRTSPGQLVRSSSVPDVSALDSQATGLSKILYPAMQPMSISSSSTINTEDDQPSLRVIVGYIGSIEMPQDSNLPSSRLQSIRSAVRRLRVEKKVHTLVLLEIRPDGIRLSNPMGVTIVHYPVSKLAMSGMYPDDKRFFGLVTIQGGDDDAAETDLSSSCHVFMVDPVFATHNVHAAKAKTFGVHCTIDPNTHRCIEFPKSCSPILRTAAKLYKDKHGGIFDVPRRQERQVSSDSDTNSDSGLGFHQGHDESIPTGDRVYVVDVHIPDSSELSPPLPEDPIPPPAGAFAIQSTPTRSGALTLETPSTRLRRLAQDSALSLQARRPSREFSQNEGFSTVSSASLSVGVKSKPAISPAAVTSSSLDPVTVEQLRSNMQRLLAMRKENVKDTQSLSDTESVVSDVRSRGSSGSRVSFNPRVAIATHAYPVAVGSRSSSSDSSFLDKRESTNRQQPPSRMRKQRHIHADSMDQPSKTKLPPPIPPKPSLSAHRHQDTARQLALAARQQPQLYSGTNWQHSEHEEGFKSNTLDDQYGRMKQGSAMLSRKSDTLDSKLSPRAYPSTAPRPARVATGGRSAFQKVSVEPDSMDFYNNSFTGAYSSRNRSNNNSNTENEPIPNENGREKSVVARGKPVPAPRPSRHLLPDRLKTAQSRSCSVPPDNRLFWENCGRELNVDDGLSVRSESVNSLERQHLRHHDRGLESDTDKAVSSESLVEVGSRNTDRSHPVPNKSPTNNNNNVGRVASWAVSFENLLQDEDGVKAFSEFLKKEYSQENIRFWLACKNFKLLQDLSQQVEIATDIFQTYLSPLATDAVNIDSHAAKHAEEQLSTPSPTMFDEAQNQIFTLMKRDSYTRFIKSSFYQSYVVREFEHDKIADKEKVKFSLSSDPDSDTQKRRMIPGFLKDISRTLSSKPADKSGSRGQVEGSGTLRKTWSRSSEDSSLERTKNKKFEGTLTADLTAMKYRLDSGGSQDESDVGRFIRVLLPDGSTSVIHVKAADSLRSILATLLSKKSDLPITSIEVFPLESDRAIDISQPMAEISCEEMRVERRSVFRIVLPDKRNVGVKAKPHRTVRDVLRPILLKYGFKIDEVVVTQSGEVVNHDVLVSTVDERRLTVIRKEQFQEWGLSSRKSIAPQDLTNGWEDLVDFEDASTQVLLAHDTFKKSKGAQFFGMLKNYSLDDGSKGVQRKAKGKNVTFGPTKSMDDQYLSNPQNNEGFLDMLTKAQSSRIDDQRGLSIDVSDLPEFLKSGSDQQSETDEGSMSPPQSRVNRDGAHSLNATGHSALYNDQVSTSSTSLDGQEPRIPQHPHYDDSRVSSQQSSSPSRSLPHSQHPHNNNDTAELEGDFSTPPSKLNSSYYTAVGGHFAYTNKTPDMNSTLQPGNKTLDDTLTPKLPLSPLPMDLPPPPQFGNEVAASTPLAPAAPPSYKDALHRSTYISHSNSNNSNNTNSLSHSHNSVTTIPGNNPGNRLSYAHHQPIIFHDEEQSARNVIDRSTPSPTTHTLVLEETTEDNNYNFYERQYRNAQNPQQTPSEPVKVTFV